MAIDTEFDPRGAARGATAALLWLGGLVLVAPLLETAALTELAQLAIDASPGALATTAIETFGKLAQPLAVVGLSAGLVAASAVVGAVWADLPRSVRHPATTTLVPLAATAVVVAPVAPSPLLFGAATLLAAAPVVLFGLAMAGAVPALGAEGAAGQRRPFLSGLAAAAVGVVGVAAAATARSVLFPPEPDDRTQPLPSAGGGSADPQSEKEGGTTTPTSGGRVTNTAGVSDVRTRDGVTLSLADTDADFGFDFEGMPQQVTPLGSHYVVDKEINNPEVDEDGWTLSVGGAAGEPYELTVDDLIGHEDSVTRTVTMVCISNQVGGDLISTGRWRGVPLRSLVEQAVPADDLTDVVTVAADGYDEAVPWSYVRDHPEVMVAYGLNGRTLSTDHGDPARLLVPGRYGMRSTKWLTELRLSPSDHISYWEQRGWDEEAVINTLSYIRAVQRRGDRVGVGGVAYAGLRGVDRVEVSLDDGATWTDASLEEPVGEYGWRRFRATVERPTRGEFTAVVRATDGTGAVQSSIPAPPHPAGSKGWHSLSVDL